MADDNHNPFWEYSLLVYARPGVAECCLSLQDERRVDVNILLFGAWLASLGRELTPGLLRRVESDVGPWRERVVKPLRTLRQDWRSLPAASPLREKVKKLELEAEGVQQQMMWESLGDLSLLPVVGAPLELNLGRVVGVGATPDSDLQRLLSLLRD